MFKKENRLIPGIKFNSSRPFTLPQFVLKEKENKLLVNRFGIIVSKKVDKRAVVRNKVKRFFREALIKMNKSMVPGHDILIIVRKEILNKAKEENVDAVRRVLEKSGLIKL